MSLFEAVKIYFLICSCNILVNAVMLKSTGVPFLCSDPECDLLIGTNEANVVNVCNYINGKKY